MSRDEVAVHVENVKKQFLLPQHKNTSIKHAFVNFARQNKKVTQKVLDGISFDVHKGDFFGIVGRNGSGKSTLLKILAGVYQPTSGAVTLYGKLTPFIELGVGFNPELSGRDNVFLNGALLGFTRNQMEDIYEDIVEFAELGPFMDQKLKNYSSGMQVRLAFSIAIKAKNEILIFDEVLAVGDEAFQRKCFDVFEKYKADKQTVILVTHDMETVRRFCNRAMLISEGKIVEIGSPRSVAGHYSDLNQKNIDDAIRKQNATESKAGQQAQYLRAEVFTQDGAPAQSFEYNDRARFKISWPGLPASMLESVGVTIVKQTGEHIGGINSRFRKHQQGWRQAGEITLEVKLDLAPGKYHLLVEAFKQEGKAVDTIAEGPTFDVKKYSHEWSGLRELTYEWVEEK